MSKQCNSCCCWGRPPPLHHHSVFTWFTCFIVSSPPPVPGLLPPALVEARFALNCFSIIGFNSKCPRVTSRDHSRPVMTPHLPLKQVLDSCLCRKPERKAFLKSLCVFSSLHSFSLHPCFYFETCAFILTFSCYGRRVKFLLVRTNTACFHANSPSPSSLTCKSPETGGKTGSIGIRQVENCTELH